MQLLHLYQYVQTKVLGQHASVPRENLSLDQASRYVSHVDTQVGHYHGMAGTGLRQEATRKVVARRPLQRVF